MEHLNIDLNLLKFDNAFIRDIQGRAATKRCVCIPIEDNDIFISKDDATGRAKAAYLHLTAWKSQEERYGETHYVKQSLSKEYKKAHPEESKNKPILGNGKPTDMPNNNAANTIQTGTVPFDESDDLPF